MSQEPKEIQCIDWRRCFAFLEIVRSFRLAIHPAKLLLCFLGLAMSFGIGVLTDQIPGIGQTEVNGRSFRDNVYYVVTQTLWGDWALPYVGRSSMGDFLQFLVAPVNAAIQSVDLVIAYWKSAPWFALINTVLSLALWAVIGGAVSRMAAVRFAREESVPWNRAIRFSLSKWPSIVTSPLIPFGVMVLLAAVVLGLGTGLPLMIPYVGEFVYGIFWGLTLVFGLVLALILVGGSFSLGLQWPTIAAEGSDAFDAISRSISYISTRPWRYLFYTLFSILYGCLTFLFVKFMTFLALRITHTGVSVFSFGTGDAHDKLIRLWDVPTIAYPWPAPGTSTVFGGEAAATYLFQFWVWAAIGMMIAFLISYFFSSQTVVYFLLRKVVDATDMEEVYMEESEEDELPVDHKVEAPEVVKIESATPKPPDAKPAGEGGEPKT